VRLFKSSPKAARMLEEKQNALQLPVRKLKLDNKTRWNSAYEMLERLRIARPAVTVCLGALENTGRTIPPDLTHEEWSQLAELAIILHPLKESTEFLSQQKHPTIGAVLPLYGRITKHHLAMNEDDPVLIATFKQEVVRDLKERWNTLEGDIADVIMLSVYLDPRVKHFGFVSDPAKREEMLRKAHRIAEQWLRRTCEQDPASQTRTVSTSNTRAIHENREKAREHDHAMQYEAGPSRSRRSMSLQSHPDSPSPPINKLIRIFGEDLVEPDNDPAIFGDEQELQEYHARPHWHFVEPAIGNSPTRTVGDPLVWWKEHEAEFPRLARLARRFLSVMATSVPSERLFSKSGWIANKRRCSLSDEKLSLLTFISCNKHHL